MPFFGLGYVGLPIVLRYCEVGFSVIGIDIDEKKVSQLNSGKSYIEHISDKKIDDLLGNQKFYATTRFQDCNTADALIVCVPTPLNQHREPDLSFVTQTTDSIVPFLRKGQIFSLESTTYPGTSEEELLPRIESTGLKVGLDIFFSIFTRKEKTLATQVLLQKPFPKFVAGILATV